MVVAADMVLEMDVYTTMPWDENMLEVEGTEDEVENKGVANVEGKEIFTGLFTYDRGRWGGQLWWLISCHWGLRTNEERSREDITAPL